MFASQGILDFAKLTNNINYYIQAETKLTAVYGNYGKSLSSITENFLLTHCPLEPDTYIH